MKTKPWQIFHESAEQHLTGEAVYVCDKHMDNQLTGYVYYSQYAHAKILHYNLQHALDTEGVVTILDYSHIPGANNLSPLHKDEPCLAKDKVECIGQALFLIAAENAEIAKRAAEKIEITFEPLVPVLSIDEAMTAGSQLAPTKKMETGNPDEAMQVAPFRLKGSLKTGGQEHWYLETQSALCVPGEGNEMTVYAASQNPTETQMVVAEVLGLDANDIECEVKRMGGGFGGKETQANHLAAWAALLAYHTRRAVKLVLFRDDDQKMTGKRHPFQSEYEIGFDEDGQILSYIVDMHADAGMATDLSPAIMDRALYHVCNTYFIPAVRASGTLWKTNLPSNTAFRGFGGPQGMAIIENAIDRIARYLKKDPVAIRMKNFYGLHKNNITHYGQKVENNRIHKIWRQLLVTSDYYDRRKKMDDFNLRHTYIKRGMAYTPVQFGISFTTAFLNQAGALVIIYKDGSVLVNHGGTEMGQGLHTKIWQIAAEEFGLPPHKVKVNATNTSKVPNTSPTAASSGTDLNGMAVKNAIDKLRKRLEPCAEKLFEEKYGKVPTTFLYKENRVWDTSNKSRCITFTALVNRAHREQVSLAATGFYRTPDLHFDKIKGKGKPFHYFAYGAAVSEVEVDTLTGGIKLIRTDILHDTGQSIHEGIDLGQVTGGFIQGVGWCTTETLRWDEQGQLLNHSPDTYKIPTIGDMPEVFHVKLLEKAPNLDVIKKSKAVGEPPFMLAFSVWLAIKDAISAVGNHQWEPDFGLPANNERILLSIEVIRRKLEM